MNLSHFKSFEAFIRIRFDELLSGNRGQTAWLRFENSERLVMYWRQYDRRIKFSVELLYDESEITYILDCQDDYDEDDDIFLFHTVGMPKSEEEYFQYSTVQDLIYDYDFYEYALSVFKQLNR